MPITVTNLLAGGDVSLDFQIMTIQQNTSFRDCKNAPRLNYLSKQDKQLTQKLIIAILISFQESLGVKTKMSTVQLFDCSLNFIARYPHESIEDLILCLKRVKLSGKKFYNSFNQMNLFELYTEYLEQKAEYLEHDNRLRYQEHEKGRNNNYTGLLSVEQVSKSYEILRKIAEESKSEGIYHTL